MVAIEVADFTPTSAPALWKPLPTGCQNERRLLLTMAVNAAVALLHDVRIPGNLDVDQVIAVVLEVYAFGGGIGGQQDADGRNVRRSLERRR